MFMIVKNVIQVRFRCGQIVLGRVICFFIMMWMRFFFMNSCDISKVRLKVQYRMVGFYLMKVLLWKQMVVLLKIMMMVSDIYSMLFILCWCSSSQVIWFSEVMMVIVVESRIGVWLVVMVLVDMVLFRYCIIRFCVVEGWFLVYLKMLKNRMMGNRLNRNFIGLVFLVS